MGSKGSAPAAPDYTPIYTAQLAQAQQNTDLGQQELAWSQAQYAQEAPYTQAYMNAMTGSMTAEEAAAQQAQSFYYTTYQPIEGQFAGQATAYNTPERAQQNAAAAQADVAQAYSGQRAAALQNLESYGVDPSQTRYGALDLGARISQAGASAAAGTQSRLQTEATGLNLENQAINIGRGYPGQISQAYQTGSSSGGAGVTAGLNTSSTYGNLMGTPYQYNALSAQNLNAAGNTLNTAFGNELASYNASTAATQNEMGGIGSLVGGLGAAALLKFSDVRLKEDIHRVGETDGGIPVYTFRYNGDPYHRTEMGVIAQELEKRQPEAVHRTREGIRLVDYARVR
jgi:hypothetical protein